jgi:hypothetical protein
MDPIIGTIVVASAREVDNGMSTGMSTRCAKRQRCFEQEDDNQSNITFEGMDDIDAFGPMTAYRRLHCPSNRNESQYPDSPSNPILVGR